MRERNGGKKEGRKVEANNVKRRTNYKEGKGERTRRDKGGRKQREEKRKTGRK